MNPRIHTWLLCFATFALVLGCDDSSSQQVDLDQADLEVSTDQADLAPDEGSDSELELTDAQQDADQNPADQADSCIPQCVGKSCGDDGCGGQCGLCEEGQCVSGQCVVEDCVAACVSDCSPGCYDMGECGEDSRALELTPNVYTLGVVLSLEGESSDLYYRVAGAATWHRGHPPVVLPDGRQASSLFMLRPDTEYEVLAIQAGEGYCQRARTLTEEPETTTSQSLYVAAGAQGGDGSQAAPLGSIQAAIELAGPGVEIRVAAGLYHEAISVSQSGSEGAYLVIKGEPGAILDGAPSQTLSWTENSANHYSVAWDGDPRYLLRDEARLYHYLSLEGLEAGIGDDGESIPEGFFATGGQLHIRSLTPPENHSWQIPTLNTGIALDGNSWVWIEGLTIRYYGEGAYAKGVDIRDSEHIVVRNNHIHDMPSPVWVRRGSSYVRIEDNTINQSAVHTWPWPAVKGTDHENSAITLSGGHGAIAANNTIFHIFNGVYTGSFGDDNDPAISYDHDVYGNRMRLVTDDGLEPEGACINNRFWMNTVDEVHNGISLAPITWGPVWVLNNRFTDYDESGFKVSNNSSGPVFLYHNTSFTDRVDQNGMNISGPFENMVFRNNIIRGTRYALEMSQSARPNDLDYDNLYTTRGAPWLKWDNNRLDTLAQLCEDYGLECHGLESEPGLEDPAAGRFALTATSSNVDAGLWIEGINDNFAGAAPDIGYLELGQSEVPVLEP